MIRQWPERDDGRGRGLLTAAQIYARMSNVLYERNDLVEAESYANRTVELYELSGHAIHGIRGYRILAVLRQAAGDVEGALSNLNSLDRLATNVDSTLMDDRLLAETNGGLVVCRLRDVQ